MSLEAACTNIILEIHPQAADSVSIWTWANFFLIIHFLAHVLNKTMKNHETTLKNNGNQPKTMKNHDHLKNHGNPPKKHEKT